MGVSCQILINKPKGGHRPGLAVSGVVKYAVNEPLEVKSVVLSLVGKGRCSWTESRTTNNRTETVTYSGNEEYFKTAVNVIDKPSDEVTIIPVGSYEFPFEFSLPGNIPPSYKDDVGRISYTLTLKFKRPGIFKFNKNFTAEVPVYSCLEDVIEEPVVFGLEKVVTKLFSKRKHIVNLKAEVNKTCFTPEEKAIINIIATNNTDVTITAVKSEVIRHITYTADCGRTNNSTTIIKGSTVQSTSLPKNSIVELHQEIPTFADMFSVNSKVLKVEYKLKVTVRLPVPHMNASVEIPIVIGENSAENVDGDPPSYWEVVCVEEKVKF